MVPSSGTAVVLVVLVCGTTFRGTYSAPPARNGKDIVLVPLVVPSTRVTSQEYLRNPNGYRGPFDFVGQLIQQVPWLPIQINVPNVFQTIGTGWNQFTEQVGTGFNQWWQQWNQRVPFLNRNPTGSDVKQPMVVMVPVEYPGGQQLVLDEAIDAFP